MAGMSGIRILRGGFKKWEIKGFFIWVWGFRVEKKVHDMGLR
jgi:hypothetical protein